MLFNVSRGPCCPSCPNSSAAFLTFANLPALAGLRPFFDSHLLRLEDEMKDGLYEVRAELPGVDPTDDIEVTVRDGQLTIKAERTQTSESNGHSEFSYGSFMRTVPLPAGADEDDINATYDRGILTVSVPLSEDHPTEKRVEVIETILVDEDDDDDDDDDDEDDRRRRRRSGRGRRRAGRARGGRGAASARRLNRIT